MHKELGGDTARTETQHVQRAIPCHVVACSAVKAGIKEEEEAMFRVMAFIFPRNLYM